MDEITTFKDKTKAILGSFNIVITNKGNDIKVFKKTIMGDKLLFDNCKKGE